MHVDIILWFKIIFKYKRAMMQGLNLMNWIEVDELSADSSTTSQVLTGSNPESLIQSLIEPLKKEP